jgi:hypothetical protein
MGRLPCARGVPCASAVDAARPVHGVGYADREVPLLAVLEARCALPHQVVDDALEVVNRAVEQIAVVVPREIGVCGGLKPPTP